MTLSCVPAVQSVQSVICQNGRGFGSKVTTAENHTAVEGEADNALASVSQRADCHSVIVPSLSHPPYVHPMQEKTRT